MNIIREIKQDLTHCRLNELPYTIYWKILILILGIWGYVIKVFLERNGWTICKQWRPWSDAAFCGVWSGSALFANYPFRGLQITMGSNAARDHKGLKEGTTQEIWLRSIVSKTYHWRGSGCDPVWSFTKINQNNIMTIKAGHLFPAFIVMILLWFILVDDQTVLLE